MENWERQTIRMCWWLKHNTIVIKHKLSNYFNDADCANWERESLPDMQLNPSLNDSKSHLEELKKRLHHYRPNTLPPLAKESFRRMMIVATDFVKWVEKYCRMSSLMTSLALEKDIFKYMTSEPPAPFVKRTHQATLNEMFSKLLESFENNSKSMYNHLTELMKRKEKDIEIKRANNKLDKLIHMHRVDELGGNHCWDMVSVPRGKQLMSVYEWMNDPKNQQNVYFSLSYACDQAFVLMPGGYPNSRAMYNFAHKHEQEFPSHP